MLEFSENRRRGIDQYLPPPADLHFQEGGGFMHRRHLHQMLGIEDASAQPPFTVRDYRQHLRMGSTFSVIALGTAPHVPNFRYWKGRTWKETARVAPRVVGFLIAECRWRQFGILARRRVCTITDVAIDRFFDQDALNVLLIEDAMRRIRGRCDIMEIEVDNDDGDTRGFYDTCGFTHCEFDQETFTMIKDIPASRNL